MKKQIKEVLGRLYPGKNVTYKYHMYRYRKKRLFFLILTIGVVTFVCVHTSSRMQGKLKEGLHLHRNEWGEGNYEVTLSVNTGTQEEVITYEVEERRYTYPELCALQKEAAKQMEILIPGKNRSLNYVTEKLYLPAQLEGYPFTIVWSSSDNQKVQSDGTVQTKQISEEGERVVLTAGFYYEDFSWQQQYYLQLFPKKLSATDKKRENIKNLLTSISEETKEEKVITLPGQIGEQKIIWREKRKNDSYLILGLFILAAIAVPYAMDEDLYKKDKQRKQELEMYYPEFVSMLQLYLAAGLTIRNAFFKMADHYKKEKAGKGKKIFLYEEIILAGHMLANGQSEDEVYRHLAERCGEIHYKKLAFVLISYKRQGNENLLRILSEEAYVAWEERRNTIKKRGKETETKLLFPMMLMLMVVMFLIVIPVYTGF